MKTAFNIDLPEGLPVPVNLLIELDWTGISFAAYTTSPFKLEAVSVYNFEAYPTVTELVSELRSILDQSSISRYKNVKTSIAFNFKESLLVPAEYFNESSRVEMLNLVYGDETDVIVYSEEIAGKDVFNVYRVAKDMVDVLHSHFPSASFVHANSLLINCNEVMDGLHCFVSHNAIKVILYKNAALQFVQQFNYNTAADVVYQLLNTCRQYAMPVEETTLILSGTIDEDSNLYSEIYKYFLHVDFSAPGTGLAEGIQKYPAHFFNHLIVMSSCV